MTRYTAFNGESYFTVRMSERRQDKKRRSRARFWAMLSTLLNGRTRSNFRSGGVGEHDITNSHRRRVCVGSTSLSTTT
jgi:hypothetical protein